MKKFSHFTLASTIIIVVITLIVADLYFWYATRSFLISEIKNEMNNQVNLSRRLINHDDIINFNYAGLKKISNEINELTGMRATLISKSGEVLADSELEIDELKNVENHIGREEIQESIALGKGFAIRKSATINKNLLYYCENLYEENRVIGFLRFALFSDNFEAKMSSLRNMILVVNFFILIIAIIFGFLWKQKLYKQVQAINSELDRFRDIGKPKQLSKQQYFEFDSLAGKIDSYSEIVAESMNRLSKKNFELLKILNSFNDGVAAFDGEGILFYSNKAFKKIGNFVLDDEEQLHYYEFIDYPPLLNDIKTFLAKRKKICKNVKYYGSTHIEYTIRSLKSDATSEPGFAIYLKNLTEIKNLEVIREDFVSNVSHEFKTPLTSIKGYTETLQSMDVINPEINKKFLAKIEKQTHKLENIVTDLLQLSRIEKNELLELSPIYPTEIIADFASDFKIQCKSLGINFDLKVAENVEKIKIFGEPQLMQTIISNLLTNSVKYGKDKGSISVILDTDGEYFRITVEDNGLGIPEADKSRIFERFYRVEKTRNVFPEGTGLGLAIVKNAVDLLGGSIDLESAYGEGSKFTVILPIIRK